jgi:hypothetical protein
MIATTTINIPVLMSSDIIFQVPFVSGEISHPDIDENIGNMNLLNNMIHHQEWDRQIQPGPE